MPALLYAGPHSYTRGASSGFKGLRPRPANRVNTLGCPSPGLPGNGSITVVVVRPTAPPPPAHSQSRSVLPESEATGNLVIGASEVSPPPPEPPEPSRNAPAG